MRKDPFDDGRAAVLSDGQREYLDGWVRAAADQLALRDWRIAVSPFDAEKAADATSWIADQGDEMFVAVSRAFLTADDSEQRATLTHELLHAHFHRTSRMALDLIEAELGKRTEAIITAAVRQTEELAIERLAHAIAAWLPVLALPGGTQ